MGDIMSKPDDNSENATDKALELDRDSIERGYKEACRSYHAIDDFRMKTLSLLPLASLIGIFGLNSESVFSQATPMSCELISFIGLFAATFTLALFIYEIGSILRCNELILRASAMENLLKIEGQFCYTSDKESRWFFFGKIFNSKFAACVIYSTVFAAWLFTVLRYGFNWSIYGCVFSALGCGLFIGVGAFILVSKLISEEKNAFKSNGCTSI
jgi:hypothetical protein